MGIRKINVFNLRNVPSKICLSETNALGPLSIIAPGSVGSEILPNDGS